MNFLCYKRLKKNRILVFNTLSSTNQFIIDNIIYMKSGDVVVTEHQTQGRGRRGKIWITPKGQSICLSIYWKLYQKLLNTTEFSVMISYVVATVLRNLGISQIIIKYPNDLYIYNKKLAGVLVEIITQNSNISHVVIGIGINIFICMRTQLEIKISKNWIGLNQIGIYPNWDVLTMVLVKKLRKVLSKFEYS